MPPVDEPPGAPDTPESTRERPPWRPTAICFALVVGGIVWCSYHYTGAMFSAGLQLLTASDDVAAIKDGVIQLMSAVVSNIVAVAAVTGLVQSITKLCER